MEAEARGLAVYQEAITQLIILSMFCVESEANLEATRIKYEEQYNKLIGQNPSVCDHLQLVLIAAFP